MQEERRSARLVITLVNNTEIIPLIFAIGKIVTCLASKEKW